MVKLLFCAAEITKLMNPQLQSASWVFDVSRLTFTSVLYDHLTTPIVEWSMTMQKYSTKKWNRTAKPCSKTLSPFSSPTRCLSPPRRGRNPWPVPAKSSLTIPLSSLAGISSRSPLPRLAVLWSRWFFKLRIMEKKGMRLCIVRMEVRSESWSILRMHCMRI